MKRGIHNVKGEGGEKGEEGEGENSQLSHVFKRSLIRVASMEQSKPNFLFGQTNSWFTYSSFK